MYKLWVALAAVCLVLGPKPAHATGFDVNDISFLLPLGNDGAPTPNIGISDLVNPLVFQGLVTTQNTLGVTASFGKSITEYRLVAFRYDPCFPSLSVQPECEPEIRLITQPFVDGVLQDTTLHLVYSVGKRGVPVASDPVLMGLKNLKQIAQSLGQGTDKKPLGIHPALNSALSRNTFSAALQAFLRNNLSASKLSVLAFMGINADNGAGEPWIFFAGTVNGGRFNLGRVRNTSVLDAGKMQASHQITVSAETVDPFLRAKFAPGALILTPTPSILEKGTQTIIPLLSAIPPSQAQKGLFHIVENPRLSSQRNTDCVSCHHATAQIIADSRFPFPVETVFSVPSGATGYVDGVNLQNGSYNFRNFGYFGGAPSIAWSTANSSADLVDFINHTIFKLPANPGIDCGTKSVQVKECLSRQPSVNASTCFLKFGCR